MKIVKKLLVGVSVDSVQSEIDKVQEEADDLQLKEEMLFSIPSDSTSDYQLSLLQTQNQRGKLCAKADYLVASTLNLGLYRKFRMMGIKVTNPLRIIFTRFALLAAVLLVLMLGYQAVLKGEQFTNWYTSHQAEKSKAKKDKFIYDTTKAYYVALEKKSNAEVCIKMNTYSSWKLEKTEEANNAVSAYNTMISCVPVERRGELKVLEYVANK